MLITQAKQLTLVIDVINLAWHNKYIDTFPTSLLTPIRKFLAFL